MTDAETLFFVVASFYLAECTFWVRTGMFVFACQRGGIWRHRINLHWALLRNPEGGILLGNLLPCGQASICQQWPLSLSPWGVYGFVSQSFSKDGRPLQPERFIRYEHISRVEEHGHDLTVNGAHFARVAAPSFAVFLAGLIRQLKVLPEADRAGAIAAGLKRHFDSAAVQERLEEFRLASADLKITCSLLFFLIFVMPPLWIQLNCQHFSPFILLDCYLGIALLTVLRFCQAHRVLYPQEKLERWKQTLISLVSPADVIHARDRLGRHLLGDFSPLAVARVVSPPSEFREFAGEVWRDLEYPILPVCPTPSEGPRETEAWFRAELRRQLGQFLSEAGISVDDLLLPPLPDAPTSLSFCPRCQGQYELMHGTCLECGDRPLHRLDGANRA